MMTAGIVFKIIMAIIVFDFVFERILDYLNQSRRAEKIPALLQGIYDDKKYRKQQNYAVENDRFSLISSSFSFILIVLFLLFDGFANVNSYLSVHISSPILLGLAFFGVLLLGMDIISLPFSLYETFGIEEKYGFNKTTPKTYVIDKLKGYILSALLGGGLYFIVFKLYEKTQQNFWIYCWLIMSAIMLFFSMFYSNLIVPLFNKQTPLPDGELKQAISEFGAKVGFKIKDVYEIDGSKRSTRANAYFTGLGPNKRIVLYDTLINELTTEELVAVLAHEIGHYKKKHTVQGIIISLAQTGIMLYVLSLFIGNSILSSALGVDEPVFHISLIAFSLLYSPISTFTGLLMNILSRKNEYEADNFAVENHSADHLISALKKLSKNNLSNLTPHPLYVFVNYSHPSLLSRIKNMIK